MRFFLILILLILPLLFQLNVGSKAAYRSIAKRFWIISSLTVFGQILMIVVSSYIMITILKDKGIKDGMPIVGVIVIGILFGIILLLIIGFQVYTMHHDNNK